MIIIGCTNTNRQKENKKNLKDMKDSYMKLLKANEQIDQENHSALYGAKLEKMR